ncbi:hypothetical protein LCGC14_1192120 [marine sediment metagenome]|uniref:Uncharacterized protein n=1 Tax=marine sediment metagenome TaxID=412755 RepID=A0A0F9PPE0_9ZZZZ
MSLSHTALVDKDPDGWIDHGVASIQKEKLFFPLYWAKQQTGRYHGPSGVRDISSMTTQDNYVYVVPIFLQQAITLDSVAFYSLEATGHSYRMALYGNTAPYRPFTRIEATNTLFTDSIGIQEWPVDRDFGPGVLWVGLALSAPHDVRSVLMTPDSPMGILRDNLLPIAGFNVISPIFSFPVEWPALSGLVQEAPLLAVQVTATE